MKYVSSFIKYLAITLCFIAAGFMAPLEAQPTTTSKIHVAIPGL